MKLLEALALALEIKAQECGHKTLIDYRSYMRNLKYYLSIKDRLAIPLSEFSKRDALHYLNYLLIEKKLEPVSRNNNLRGPKALLNVLKAREYITENTLDRIKYFKVKQKKKGFLQSGNSNDHELCKRDR
jgi:hypothetical protein